MKDSELARQSIEFSVCLVDYYKWLAYEMREYVMSKQVLRSGTSIGANIHEAQYAVSKADFINKMHIALKEAYETQYWFCVLERTSYLPDKYYVLKEQSTSLKRMLISTLNTCKK